MAKVEIALAGHAVTVESDDPLTTLADVALRLYESTKLDAKAIPTGFDTSFAHIERDPDYLE